MYYIKEIAAKLKALRIEKGLSQQELAEKLRCSQGYISKLEQGKINLEIYDAYRICKAMGVNFGSFAAYVEKVMETSFVDYSAAEEKLRADQADKELGQGYLDWVSNDASLNPPVKKALDKLPNGYVLIEFKGGKSIVHHKEDGLWDNEDVYEHVRQCYFKYGKLTYLLEKEYEGEKE